VPNDLDDAKFRLKQEGRRFETHIIPAGDGKPAVAVILAPAP
jgi:hypothetical protein